MQTIVQPNPSSTAMATRSHLREFAYYFLASLLALSADMAVLLTLARVIHYLAAATAGFLVGALVAYFLSIRFVFGRRRLAHAARRELIIFAVIGVVGLGVNNAVIFAAVETVALPLAVAKILAAGITFLVNFGLRKRLLF